MAALEEQHLLADRALGYVELYGAYTETEARYRVDRLLALWDRMDADDRQAFCLDPAAVDWDAYVRDIHLPSVIEHARVRTTPGKSTQPNRADRARKAILSPDRHLAAFDLENTLIASNVVDSYAWLASRHLPAGRAGRLRGRPGARGPVPAGPRPPGPGRLPPLLLPPLRGCPGRPAARRRMGALPPPAAGQVVPRRHRPGPASTGPSATAPCSSPVPSTSWSSPCARCSTTSSAPAWARPTARFTGRLEELPPIGEARALVLADYAEAEGLRARGVDGLRRLGQRPAHARGGRLPGGGQPRGQAGRHRPAAGLARRALAQGRRAAPSRSCPSGRSTAAARSRRGRTSAGRADRGGAGRAVGSVGVGHR